MKTGKREDGKTGGAAGGAGVSPVVSGVTPETRERPILFSGPMVRAILEGRKTQTRRVVKPQPYHDEEAPHRAPRPMPDGRFAMPESHVADALVFCPYGQPGDRLWVRETFTTLDCHHGQIVYRADGEANLTDVVWKPSIFMARRLSRLTLEIVRSRVERVQDISADDACAEGMQYPVLPFADDPSKVRPLFCLTDPYLAKHLPRRHFSHESLLRAHFAALWDRINEKRGFGWASNPWVWVVEFKKI